MSDRYFSSGNLTEFGGTWKMESHFSGFRIPAMSVHLAEAIIMA
jgi:hypothetical protein